MDFGASLLDMNSITFSMHQTSLASNYDCKATLRPHAWVLYFCPLIILMLGENLRHY